jgi:Asp-tRNA(Asn)/Glu-tRNA(Gln) amidotransferase A subunit family amidase
LSRPRPRFPEPSAREWLRNLRRGDLSSRELAAHYLERIDAVNGALNAVVALRPDRVLAEAEAADVARADGRDDPLLGLVLTVKDCFDVEGYPTTAGSHARSGHVAARDAVVVGRLRAAGAIVLAKTNLPECSQSYETDNALFGRTNNPFDTDRTSGGSSGGEAALLGADASPVGLGSDGGGSIRVPSHYCGVVGLRPTVGRVPETGMWPPTRSTGFMDLFCIGPMGRSVADTELLLPILAGPDGVDPYAHPVPLESHQSPGTRRRVGIYEDDGTVRPTDGTRAAIQRAGEQLEAAGYEVEPVSPPKVGEATELFFAVAGADGGSILRAQVAAAGGRHHPQFRQLLESFPDTPPSAADYFSLLARVFAFRARVREWLSGYEVVVCPVVSGPAPIHGMPPAGVRPDRYMHYEAFNYVHTYAMAGVPAGSVPCGSEGDLPIGVQVVAAPYREQAVFDAMRVIEQAQTQ